MVDNDLENLLNDSNSKSYLGENNPSEALELPEGKIRIYGTASQSIVDGPGLRYAVFTQGCRHACRGCHNKDSWNFNSGTIVDIDDILDEMSKDPLCSGLSISGGDPFYRMDEVCQLITAARSRFGDISIWIWSGFLYEDLIINDKAREILELCDVLIDGPYIQSQHSPDLMWRGSSNQRVIDLKKTTDGNIVCLDLNDYGDKPKRRFGYHPVTLTFFSKKSPASKVGMNCDRFLTE